MTQRTPATTEKRHTKVYSQIPVTLPAASMLMCRGADAAADPSSSGPAERFADIAAN